MKRLLQLCIVLFALCISIAAQPAMRQDSINRAIFAEVVEQIGGKANLPMNELVVEVALHFQGTDYIGASLESVPEQLNVYLDKTDCILFVEMSTCIALTLKGIRIEQGAAPSPAGSLPPSYELLVDNIRNMRYRGGVVDGYASRIHYTSEWLLQNHANGILQEYTSDRGEQFEQQFFWMSAHPKNYFQLQQDPCELGKIRLMEERLNEAKPYYRLTQEMLHKPEVMGSIESGDIITFVSPRPGLDLAHVALAYRLPNGEMHFIHASYGAKKVIIEPKTLADYAKNGIRISRLKNL